MKVWIYIYFPVFRNFNCRQNSYSVGMSHRPASFRKPVRWTRDRFSLILDWSDLGFLFERLFFCNFFVWSIVWAADTLCRRLFVRLDLNSYWIFLHMILPGVILGHIEVKASKSMSSLGFIGGHKCEPPIF